jgi:hypothetical protein
MTATREPERLLTIAQAAELASYGEDTILQWIARGIAARRPRGDVPGRGTPTSASRRRRSGPGSTRSPSSDARPRPRRAGGRLRRSNPRRSPVVYRHGDN